MSSFGDLRQEFRPMFALALPVVLAEMGWMTMGIVDALMVGRLSPEAIGAVGIGSSLFLAVAIFAMGLTLGLDTLVSHAFGAGRIETCHKWLLHGIALSALLTPPIMLVLNALSNSLAGWGLTPSVLQLTKPYLDALNWSVLPLLLYSTFRRYLQGMGAVRPVMIALVSANIVNAIGNWILIFGKLGAPAMGVRGSAWATVFARVAMAAFLGFVIIRRERGVEPRLLETPRRLEVSRMRQLVVLGFPAAMQVTLEVGVFAAATALAGRLEPVSLAAHQIALNVASLTFMVPLGVASAGAVRVGHAFGRRDSAGVARAGWTALLFGAAFMSAAAAAFIVVPRTLIGAFTKDSGVLEVGMSLLAIAAIFQLFDGIQGVATGILRGLGDTRTAMLWNLAGHWLIGLPLGYVLCFSVGLGVSGLWWGLSTGLIICGAALLFVWSSRAHAASHLLTFES